jgi:hypothetical protein
MAYTLDFMDLKQIIRLHSDGYSNRKIGDTLIISRNSVNSYMRLFRGSDVGLEELLSLDPSAFRAVLPFKLLNDVDGRKRALRMASIRINNTYVAQLNRAFRRVGKVSCSNPYTAPFKPQHKRKTLASSQSSDQLECCRITPSPKQSNSNQLHLPYVPHPIH